MPFDDDLADQPKHEDDPVERESLPEDFSNSAGVSRGDCDTGDGAADDPACDHEVTAQVQDLVLEETKPGRGIEGFEGEEVGGG